MMDIKDWITIIAAIAGPILAVQAQKAVESFRERKSRKTTLFTSLMATRAARVSPEHVRALNMIDLVFFGTRTLGFKRRSKGEQTVLNAWKEYLDHLNVGHTPETLPTWLSRGDELLTNLLFAMAEDTDYDFDRVQLKRGAYSPTAQAELDAQQGQVRQRLLSVLGGETPLKMHVVALEGLQHAEPAQNQ